MPYFKDADDVYAHLGRFLRELAVDPESAPALRRADTTLQMRLRQPDAVITLRTPQDEQPAQVDLGDTSLQPEVILQMDADTAHALWLGELNAAVALAKGEIRARGPIAKILKVLPLVKPAFRHYRDRTESRGSEPPQDEAAVAPDAGEQADAAPEAQPDAGEQADAAPEAQPDAAPDAQAETAAAAQREGEPG